jgi:hypothetical protein
MRTQLQAEMKTEIERIQELLPTELFEGSKDWREGSVADRVEWLLSMYASAKEEVERLEKLVDDIEDDLAAAVQYNFDRS